MRVSQDTIDEYIRRSFAYCPETGRITWKIPGGRWGVYPVGSDVGCVNQLGYRQTGYKGSALLLHRVAWFLHTGAWPVGQIDHWDTDPSNNRFSNLRDLVNGENPQNQRKANKRNIVGLLGVSPSGPRFRAKIKAGGVKYNLGTFEKAEDAHAAYLTAKRQLHPACTL